MFARFALPCAVLVLASGISRAQSKEPSDAWLMQNYHFTGPVPTSRSAPADPLILQLQDIQNTTLAILRKADFAGDYQAALAAAAQATANAQLMAALTARSQPTKAESRPKDRGRRRRSERRR